MENASAHPSPRFEMLSVMAKLITWYATKWNTGDYLPFMLCQAYQGSNFETRWIGTKVVRERFLTGTEPSGHSITERARFQRVARRWPIDVWLMRLSFGILERGNCLYCGAEAEAHHPDYNKPLWLVWLCADHHRIHHARLAAETSQLSRQVARHSWISFRHAGSIGSRLLPPSAESIGHEGQYAPVAERLKKYEAALAAIVERRKT